jgi:phage terminase large subunit-like protein
MIETGRRKDHKSIAFRRIVVAVDPAVSVSETSDETGIIVAGIDDQDRGFVLEDISGKYTPTEWASKAVVAYHKWEADRIVAEKNQGGAMVENTIRVIDQNVPITLVHASRGKVARAEPISALYEQGRVHHVGGFPLLEDQLCSFEPGSTKSPDRLDALVWALTDLMITNNVKGMVAWEMARQEATAPRDAPEPIKPEYAIGSVEWAAEQAKDAEGRCERL